MVAAVAPPLTEPASSPAIAAIVVSYRSEATLDACLTRLRAAHYVAEIVVVDNASDDRSVSIAEQHACCDSRLRVIANSGNSGFAKACNQGARNCESIWLAFVNPDCWVEPGSLAQLRDHLAETANGGLIGADLVDAGGQRDAAARRREPTLARLLAGAGRRASVAAPIATEQHVQRVDAISGALMLLPRDLFESIDGFDEGYWLHAEDLDLCRRVRDAGYGVWVANDIRVVHVRGVSSRTRPWLVEWHKHRGMWRYFRKFEAPAAGTGKRVLAFFAIGSHLLIAAPAAWLRAQR